uniref:Ig-like domain-containing protein n=1 Tax=Callorhinchus milii TaxID=7868 RepID=A0A4W3HW98_CALMI
MQFCIVLFPIFCFTRNCYLWQSCNPRHQMQGFYYQQKKLWIQQIPPREVILTLPVLFKTELQNEEAQEGNTVTLRCEVTKADAPVKWKKGSVLLHSSDKHEMKQKGASVELLIRDLKPGDTGEYTCDTGDKKSTATLKVKGRTTIFFVRVG